MHIRKWPEKWYHNLIAISIENPFKTWWKAKKYFKFPNIKVFMFYNKNSFPYATSKWRGKILDVDIHDLYWKDKWNSPRHEINPLIYVCLFSRLGLWITFCKTYINEFGEKEDQSSHYWEYVLDYLYYSKSLKLSSVWFMDSKIAKIDTYKPLKLYVPEQLISLNKRGLQTFKKLYTNV